jgi:hypothetical protein
VLYHTFADRMGCKTESLPQIIHKFLIKGRVKNDLPSTLVYGANQIPSIQRKERPSERKGRLRLCYLTGEREGRMESNITTAKKALSSLLIFSPCVGH